MNKDAQDSFYWFIPVFSGCSTGNCKYLVNFSGFVYVVGFVFSGLQV
jgi:hypothetical protein